VAVVWVVFDLDGDWLSDSCLGICSGGFSPRTILTTFKVMRNVTF